MMNNNYTITKRAIVFAFIILALIVLSIKGLAVINKPRHLDIGFVQKIRADQFKILHAAYPRLDYKTFVVIEHNALWYKDDIYRICKQIFAESEFNRNAMSKCGAVGLLQLMPDTADALGVKDRTDPEENISGGLKHFHRVCMRKAHGNVRIALMYYNAGQNRQLKDMPMSTKEYAEKCTRGIMVASVN
jgi:hypothetical protein